MSTHQDCLLAVNPKPHILDSIRAEGYGAISVFPEQAPGYAETQSVAVLEQVTDPIAVAQRLEEAGLRARVVGVVCHSEVALTLAGNIALHLGLPANPAETMQLTMDKAAMRAALAGEDSAVAFAVAQGPEDVAAMLAAHEAVVAKPTDGSGSIGVQVVRSLDEAKELTYPILVEEYLDGPEFSVEALSAHGKHRVLGVTEKFLFPGTVVESGHLFPARLDAALAEEIASFTEAFLERIGIVVGVTHTEVKLTSRGIRVIETHTRSGGDHIAKLVALATGLDPLRASVLVAAGQDLPTILPPTHWATIQFRQPPAGTVAQVTGLGEAQRAPGVAFLESTLAPGVAIGPVTSSLDRVLGVVSTGDSPDEALSRAAFALDQVRVDYA